MDYSVHNGGLQNATRRMRDALWTAGNGTVVYYLDSGNPTSPEKVFNPFAHRVVDAEARAKLAVRPSELAWAWTYALGSFVRSTALLLLIDMYVYYCAPACVPAISVLSCCW